MRRKKQPSGKGFERAIEIMDAKRKQLQQPAAGPWVTDRPAPQTTEMVIVAYEDDEYMVMRARTAGYFHPTRRPWAHINPPVKP